MSGILQMFGYGGSSSNLPVNTVAPVVSGTAVEGQTLTTTNGTWTSTPAITGYTYQWQRNTSNILSATSSTYVLVNADVGNTVRCVVTATNPLGSASANSNSTGTVLPASYINATTSGATVTTSGNYKTAVFNGSGTYTVNTVGVGSPESNSIEYLVIAGGGSGGDYYYNGSGGGAGGFRANGTNDQVVTAQVYTVTVGAGGNSSNATDSSIGSLIVSTAGGWGAHIYNIPPTSGGSGGGGLANADMPTYPLTLTGAGAAGTAGQGNAGGSGVSARGGLYTGTNNGNGGGGGAGAVGGNGVASLGGSVGTGGNGGAGSASSITGSSVTYAGGGGGAGYVQNSPSVGVGGTGGSGGGGTGGSGAGGPGGGGTAGTANTGGGGGGGYDQPRSGGSGKVVIKWRFQ